MQENHSDFSGVAQHVLILGSSGHVQPNPTEPAQPAHTTIQLDSTQKSVKPKSACAAPGVSAIKAQDFFGAVQHELRLLREDQADQSMRQSEPFFTK